MPTNTPQARDAGKTGRIGMTSSRGALDDGGQASTADPAPARDDRVRTAPKRVAYIMSRFPKITETFVLYEMLELERRGFDVGIYPLLKVDETVTHPEVREVMPRVRYTPFISVAIIRANLRFIFRRPRRYWRMLRRIVAGTIGNPGFFGKALLVMPKSVLFAYEIESKGYSHVHAHFATHPTVAAMIVNLLTGIPYSFTAHGSDIHKNQHMLGEKIRSAAFVVTISNYNVRFLVKKLGDDVAEKIRVVHCGVDTESFSIAPHSKDTGPFAILCVASFREVKGHRYLLDACRILDERGIPFVCNLVGDGSLRKQIEKRIVENGLQGKVVLHGARERPYIIELMRNSHVAVLTSIRGSSGNREGIPVTLMEAMAAGLPVVSSQLSGIPELVETNVTGLLTPPGDSLAIADALESLFRSPDTRRDMGLAGRQKVSDQFEQQTTVAELAALIEQSIGSG